ncbi:PucR family transcriptional regulator [Salipaludibacillus daqingensis]|uniref:PucR family transcriptional regulator n=1 Tax=Salipaludibacillus daqingensis TaxID=3041001 RepID=UPI002473B367|nr:helix-turn-helix domain-containing protein [Salipaludibacillus daqingensis]
MERDIHLLTMGIMEELSDGRGYGGILRQFCRFFECEAVLTDDLYQTLAHSVEDGKLLSPEMTYVYDDGSYQVLNDHTGQSWEAASVALTEESVKFAALYIRKSTSDQLLKHRDWNQGVQLLARSVLIERQKQKELTEEGRQYREAFIFDLLYGNMKSKSDILSKGKIWGWDFSVPHIAIVFELLDYEIYSNDDRFLDRLYRQFEVTLTKKMIVPVLLNKREEIILLLPLKDRGTKKEKYESVKQTISLLKKVSEPLLEGRKLSVGAGRMYTEPTEWFRSYQEAKIARGLEEGIQESDVIFFKDIGLMKLIYHHDPQELHEFYQDTFDELLSYEKQSDFSLIDTLEGYILNNCDLKQTAEAMFLHRNTVRYRLAKVEELLQIDLDDMSTKINIAVAFKIRELRKISYN